MRLLSAAELGAKPDRKERVVTHRFGVYLLGIRLKVVGVQTSEIAGCRTFAKSLSACCRFLKVKELK